MFVQRLPIVSAGQMQLLQSVLSCLVDHFSDFNMNAMVLDTEHPFVV
jgi:hypothetical protein